MIELKEENNMPLQYPYIHASALDSGSIDTAYYVNSTFSDLAMQTSTNYSEMYVVSVCTHDELLLLSLHIVPSRVEY